VSSFLESPKGEHGGQKGRNVFLRDSERGGRTSLGTTSIQVEVWSVNAQAKRRLTPFTVGRGGRKSARVL